MPTERLLSMDEIHDNMEYLNMRLAILEKVRKTLEPDMAILTLSDMKSSNNEYNEYNKYKSLIKHRYNDIEAFRAIVKDTLNYWQMISYHKYDNYFAIEPECTLHNSDIDFSMYNWGESKIEVFTASVTISETNYDSVNKMLSFDFEKFMDNYFADINKFVKKYDIIIGNEGNQCVVSKEDVRFRLNKKTKSNIYRLLTSTSNANFQLKNKQILENIYQYFPENKKVI